jgi:hypothetical protein
MRTALTLLYRDGPTCARVHELSVHADVRRRTANVNTHVLLRAVYQTGGVKHARYVEAALHRRSQQRRLRNIYTANRNSAGCAIPPVGRVQRSLYMRDTPIAQYCRFLGHTVLCVEPQALCQVCALASRLPSHEVCVTLHLPYNMLVCTAAAYPLYSRPS